MSAAQRLFYQLSVHRLKLATAESCTGGLMAAALTDLPGSSDIFDRGFVTYSNAAKVEQLGVAYDVIVKCGAVSEDVAAAMAQGALVHSAADITVAVTGVAGPGGGSLEKPVGLVWFAVAKRGSVITHCEKFGPLARSEIRSLAVNCAIELVSTTIANAL